ncbi:MAG TPA: hypothetical protein VF559_05015 [Caulobacteraceae bacterium]
MFSVDILGVMSAVNFNDQPPAETDEVEVIPAKRGLPPEVNALRVQPLELQPQPDLLLRHLLA